MNSTIEKKNILNVIKDMKDSYENVIKDPNKTTGHYIRSQKLIKKLHEYIRMELEDSGISSNNIKLEEELYGGINYKKQDICVLPGDFKGNKDEIKITWGQEKNRGKSTYHENNMEKILSINVRSQLSSLAKNKDTLNERSFAEAYNLHLRCNNMCLGEVYLIPVYEYDVDQIKKNKVEFIKPLECDMKMFKYISNNSLDELCSIPNTLKKLDEINAKFGELKIGKELYEIYKERLDIRKKYNNKAPKIPEEKSEITVELESDTKRYEEIMNRIDKIRKYSIKRIKSIRNNVASYINFFDEIDRRKNKDTDLHKYERCSLLIVDFSKEYPKLYNSIEDLKEDGILDIDFDNYSECLGFENFIEDLMEEYSKRFGDLF